MNILQNNNIIIAKYLLKGWYLSAIEINRYPGCTTRTSVPSQPIYKKKSIRSILVRFLKLLELTFKSSRPSLQNKIKKRMLVSFLKLLQLTFKSHNRTYKI